MATAIREAGKWQVNPCHLAAITIWKNPMYEDLYNRIKANCIIDPTTGCHLWQGGDDGKPDPYGRISYRGQKIATHIGVMKHKEGKIPKGKQVEHRCVRRLCCNEDHLLIVTVKKNAKLREKRKHFKHDTIRCLAVSTR